MLVVDTSASMAFPERGVTKFRYAASSRRRWRISSSTGRRGRLDDDERRVAAVSAGARRAHAPARAHARARRGSSLAGCGMPQRVLARAAELLSRRGVIIVLSDFYDAEDGHASRASTRGDARTRRRDAAGRLAGRDRRFRSAAISTSRTWNPAIASGHRRRRDSVAVSRRDGGFSRAVPQPGAAGGARLRALHDRHAA